MCDDNLTDYEDIIQCIMKNDTKPLISPQFVNTTKENPYRQEIKMAYFIAYCLVLIFGVTLNITVIVIGCWKYKQLRNVVIWIVALAVTHLASCVSVVLQLLYVHNDFTWDYGNVGCKLSSYITYGSMFSTASMLSLWSISSALSDKACFKISKNCNIILISLSWTIAALLACPSLFSREVRENQCIDDYDFNKKATTHDGIARQKITVVMRFLTGLLLPAVIMFLCCCLSSTRRKCKLCKKQAEIICAIKIVYFVCWGPQIFLILLQATGGNILGSDMTKYGLPGATILAMSHCFISPLFYLLLGCSMKMEWMTHDPYQDHHNEEGESLPLRK